MNDVDEAAVPFGAGSRTAATVAPTAPAGLASLDFELSTDKNLYEVYRFTTPLGEAQLTARTVSNRASASWSYWRQSQPRPC